MLLRPHHGLCIQFYEGKGYSKEFTKQMDSLIESIALNQELTLTLHSGTDILCDACPNNLQGECKTAEQVAGYDRAVLNLSSLNAGDTISITSFLKQVKQEIIQKDRLKDICSDCSWYSICSSKVSLVK